jgi:hypothetical protein
MKYAKWIVLLIAALSLAVASAASAAGPNQANHNNHGKVCKKGYHRNGKKCIKNRAAQPTGVPSPQAPAGPAGPAGNPGPTGPAGPSGPAGTNGTNGSNGSNGTNGEDLTTPFPYDNITPESRTDNPVSLGFAATGTTEFGSQVALGVEGGVTGPEVEVLMSVWTCEHGEWNGTGDNACSTTNPAATFAAPLTLNVYEVTYENEVGDLIASTDQTFDLHYRPNGDATCPDPTSFKASDGHCQHGSPQAVTFTDLTAALPHRFILAVEYDPTGPLDALNVGLEGPPTIGHNPLEAREGVYWDSAWYGQQNTTFHLDEEPELPVGESQLAARIIDDGVMALPRPTL